MLFEKQAIAKYIQDKIRTLSPEPSNKAELNTNICGLRAEIEAARDKTIRSASIRAIIPAIVAQYNIDSQVSESSSSLPVLQTQLQTMQDAISSIQAFILALEAKINGNKIAQQAIRCAQMTRQLSANLNREDYDSTPTNSQLTLLETESTTLKTQLETLRQASIGFQTEQQELKSTIQRKTEREARLHSVSAMITFFTSSQIFSSDTDNEASDLEASMRNAPIKVTQFLSGNLQESLSLVLGDDLLSSTQKCLEEIRTRYRQLGEEFTDAEIIRLWKETSALPATRALCDQLIIQQIETSLDSLIKQDIPENQNKLKECQEKIAALEIAIKQHSNDRTLLDSQKAWTRRLNVLKNILSYLFYAAIVLSIILCLLTLSTLSVLDAPAAAISGVYLLKLMGGTVGAWIASMSLMTLRSSVDNYCSKRDLDERRKQNTLDLNQSTNAASLKRQKHIKSKLETSIGDLHSKVAFFTQELTKVSNSSRTLEP